MYITDQRNSNQLTPGQRTDQYMDTEAAIY